MVERSHQIADTPVGIRRLGRILPPVKHGRRYQRYVAGRKGLACVARRPAAVSVNDVIQLPCIVSVQFCFGTGFDSLVYEEERVVFRFG